MTDTMKNPSCFLYGPGDARIEEAPYPTITNPHDVIIRISYVGVCGSDVTTHTSPNPHPYTHSYIPGAFLEPRRHTQ